MGLGQRVSKNAKALRLNQGLSQQDLSTKTGLTVRYISRLENNAQNLTLDVLERLANALECSVNEIIGEEKAPSVKIPGKSIDETIRFLQSLKARL